MTLYVNAQNFPGLFSGALNASKAVSIQAAQVKDAEKLIEGGNIVAEGMKSWLDLKGNPVASGSADQAAALLATAGIVSGLLAKPATEFLKPLAVATGINVGALGIVISGVQLNAAYDNLQSVLADSTKTAAERDQAYRDLADKLAGVVASIGGAIAAVPGLAPLGLAIWLGGALAQQYLNGNIERAIKIVQEDGFWPGVLEDFRKLVIPGYRTERAIADAVNARFSNGTRAPRRDPLAIDIDSDGIETLPEGQSVLFDHDADGVKTATGWLKGDDAWLVLDRNGNGTIDSGRELFGVDTLITQPLGNGLTTSINASSGFQALASLDANHDGVFDANDAAFAQVQLWQDANGDGISQATELSSLTQKGIVSISLAHDGSSEQLAGGNTVTGKAVVTRSNGSTGEAAAVALNGTAANLNLTNNPFYRQFTDQIPLTAQAQALPDMTGSGWTRDLREAMSQDSVAAAALAAGVQQFATAGTSRDAQLAQMDALLSLWAASTGRFDPTDDPEVRQISTSVAGATFFENGYYVTPTRFTIAEPGTPLGGSVVQAVLPEKYYEIRNGQREMTAAGVELLRRIELLEVFNGRRLFDAVINVASASSNGGQSSGGGGSSNTGGSGGGLFTFSLAQEQLDAFQSSYDALFESVYGALVMQTRLRPYLDAVQLVSDEQGIRFDASASLAMLQTLKVTDAAAAFTDLAEMVRFGYSTFSDAGFDALTTLSQWVSDLPAGSPIFSTLATLKVHLGASTASYDGNDIYLGDDAGNGYDGGAGQDQLYGGAGADTLSGGEGNDVLDGGSGTDSLTGGAGDDLYVWGLGSGKDVINNYDLTPGHVDTLRVKDGISPSQVSLVREGYDLLVSSKTSADQVRIAAYFSANRSLDQISFADGTVWDAAKLAELTQQATAGNDLIEYGGSDDTVLGLEGNDTLIGGLGNDFLDGGSGNDTYLFSKGAGADVVKDGDATAGNVDVIQFTDVRSSDVTAVERRGDNLIIKYGATDQVTVQRYFDSYNHDKVEQFKFSDGVTWDDADVMAHALTIGTAGDDWISGYNGGPNRTQAEAGDDHVFGGDQADSLDGGEGNDTVFGYVGNDTLIGGLGNDSLDAGDGNDSLSGGDGDDRLVGGEGHDTMTGGQGNDNLEGYTGNDTYVFSKGSGADAVRDTDTTAGNVDVIEFTDVLSSDVTAVERHRDDLVVKYGATDQITVQGYFDSNNYSRVEQFKFSDGVTWDVAAVMAHTLTLGTAADDQIVGYNGGPNLTQAGAGNDTVYGGDQADSLDGGDGDDTLYGYAGNDSLVGGDGDDVLDGGDGDDVLDGGVGTDQLKGGSGADTYKFAAANGWDRITTGEKNDAKDIVVLAGTINPGDVRLRPDGNDLRIGVKDANGSFETQGIVIRNHFDGEAIKEIRFADGTVWSSADLLSHIEGTFGTSGANNLYAIEGANNRLYGLGGSDYLYGSNGAGDLLDGGDDGDMLYGYAGNDTLLGGSGDDSLNGGDGDDILDGGSGTDRFFGEGGTDTYKFNAVDGWEQITTGEWYGAKDSVVFGDAIKVSDVQLRRYGDDLHIRVKDANGSFETQGVVIKKHFAGEDIKEIRFADGTAWVGVQMMEQLIGNLGNSSNNYLSSVEGVSNRLFGYAGEDTLYGSNSSGDLLDGGDGGDTLYGYAGNDTLLGGAGDDSLNGGDGSDVLDGGSGTDRFFGEGGADIYKFDAVDGWEQITTGEWYGAKDSVVFGDAIKVSDVQLRRYGDDLHIRVKDASDSFESQGVIIKKHFTGEDIKEIRFADGTVWVSNDLLSRVSGTYGNASANNLYATEGLSNRMFGLEGNDTLYGSYSSGDVLDGGDGSDALYGYDGNDTLYGGAGGDVLWGGEGDDVLDGGAGVDGLIGGRGNNTYVFGRGYGYDPIWGGGADSTSGKLNVLQFKPGITPSDIVARRFVDEDGHQSVELAVAGTGDRVVVRMFFKYDDPNNAENGLQQVRFDSGEIWDISTIVAKAFAGTDANDTYNGTVLSDLMNGGAGDDTIYGRVGNDVINGGTGNDVLYGEGGDDTLDGGAGNDTLNGAAGADSYVFGRGYGNDVIVDSDTNASVKDVLTFGAGIVQSNLLFTRSGNALVATIQDTSETLTIQDWYAGNRVEEFRFSDGTILTDVQAQSLVGAMAAFGPTAAGITMVDESRQRGAHAIGLAVSGMA